MIPILAVFLGLLRGFDEGNIEELVKEAFSVFIALLISVFVVVAFGLLTATDLGLAFIETWNLTGVFSMVVVPLLSSVIGTVLFLIAALVTSAIKKA
jgi:hypothetical protein